MVVCFNTDSIPAESPDCADTMLFDIAKGIVTLVKDHPRKVEFYCDFEKDKCYIAPHYTMGHCFRKNMRNSQNRESVLVFQEFQNRSPAIDWYSSEELEKITRCGLTCYGYHPNCIELFYYAHTMNGVVASFPTANIWAADYLPLQIEMLEPVEVANIHSSDISGIVEKQHKNISFFLLHNAERFQKTHYFQKKQQVYKELSTGRYWYFDAFHEDNRAHFEVFDTQGTHCGEASLSGELNTLRKDCSKRLQLS